MSISPGNPRLLVLYARSDALGDGLLRLPAVRSARSAFPDARIVYATGRDTSLASTLRRQIEGVVDEVRPRSSLPQVLTEFAPRRGEAAVADFRTVIGWHVGERLRVLPRGVIYEANFPAYALSWIPRGFGLRPAHNAWRYHRVVERLAGRTLPFDFRITPLAAARQQARRLLAGIDGPLVLMGANSAPHKALHARQMAAVARELLRRGHAVVHIHSPGHGPTAAEMAELVPGLRTIGTDTDCGGVPLLEVLFALGERATAYIGPEGGLAHALAAVLVPLVVLNHGASMDRWRPLSGIVEIVDARHDTQTRRTADIEPGAILQAFDRLIAVRRRCHPVEPVAAQRLSREIQSTGPVAQVDRAADS